jgi:HEAT repeat protein
MRVAVVLGLVFVAARAPSAPADVDARARQKQEKRLVDGDTEVRREAASFLWSNADAGSVPALAAALRDADPRVRSLAAGALWKLGEAARPAEAALERALRDSSARVRLNAAAALETLGTPPEAMADAIAVGLDDPDVEVRADAAHALRRAGAPAVQILPVLLGCVRESQRSRGRDSSRVSAMQSQCRGDLRNLGILPKEAMPILDDALKEGDAEERRAAAEAIGKAGGAARAEIPALIGALGDPEADVRGAAADALGRIGNAARSSVPALSRTVRSDPVAEVRQRALRALEDVDATAAEALKSSAAKQESR